MAGRRVRSDSWRVPLHAALDLAALRTPPVPGPRTLPGRRVARGSLVAAFLAAILLLGLTSTTTLAATTVTPKCDAVNLRTGPSTTYTKKTSVNEGAKLTVVATVTGGSYATSCNGIALSGS